MRQQCRTSCVESYEMTLEAGFDIHRRIQWNSPGFAPSPDSPDG